MPRPNVIFILVDDMGYGDFGVFSEGRTRTPVLDQLVGEGLCLTQQYAASPVCAPSRAGLMTGRYPHRTGAIDTLDARGLDRLALRERTVGDVFAGAGYATGLVGKWHLGAADPRYHPNRRGFQEFVGFRGGWWDYWDWTLDCNGSFQRSDGRYLTEVFTEEALGFIRRHAHEPFFLHLAYNAPHFPLQAPEEEIAPFRETGRYTEAVSAIYGMIRRVDTGVGRICEELERQGIAEDTILIFTSDNGPQFGGEGENCTTRDNCNFNGAKGLVYEGGIRVPLIVRWPGGLPGARAAHDFVHFTDWLPTLAAAAEIDLPSELRLDGGNVLPALRGERGAVNPRRFWQWNRYTPVVECNAAMRDGDWKLLRPALPECMWISREDAVMDQETKRDPARRSSICRDPEPEREVPTPPPAELYNLAEDPEEQHNLAEAEPERAAQMLRELERWFEEVEAERRTIEEEDE